MIDWIGFDADDTLWQNEEYYTAGRERFRSLLAPYGLGNVPDSDIDAVEISNLPYYGYGAMSFTLSLIEAGIRLTKGQFSGDDILALLDHARHMLSDPTRVYPHAAAVLEGLAQRFPLMLITKGDLRHQEAKVAQSGLAGFFRVVEVVSEKTPVTYRTLLAKHGIAPERFLMVGNSLRSDITPVLDLGGWGIYIPNGLTWAHEHMELPGTEAARFFQVAHLGEVTGIVEKMESG